MRPSTILLPVVFSLAAAGGCSDKTSLTYTICNSSPTDVCVTVGGDQPQVVGRGDCVDFSKTTEDDCVTVTVAVKVTDTSSLGPCGTSKGTKCMKDGETWTVD